MSSPTPPKGVVAEEPPEMSLSAVVQPGVAGIEMLRTACLLTLAGLGILAAMYLLAEVLVPFVLAAFLSLLLNPLIDVQVRRMHWPRPVAVGASFTMGVLVLLAVVAVLVPVVVGQVRQFDYLEMYSTGMDRLVAWLPEQVRDELDLAALRAEVRTWGASVLGRLLPAAGEGLVGLMTGGGLVLVFLLFLLLGRGDNPVPPDSLRGQIERRIQSYIAVTFLISAATGLLVGLSLWLLGVRLAWLFGVLAFVLNFIPNIGSAFATLLPLPVVLLDPSLAPWAKVAAFIVPGTIQFLLGNVVAPKMLGDTLQLSPVAVLLGLILLGAIWGLAGMVMSTPMLATVKIVFERVPLLAPLARLLAGEGFAPKPAAA